MKTQNNKTTLMSIQMTKIKSEELRGLGMKIATSVEMVEMSWCVKVRIVEKLLITNALVSSSLQLVTGIVKNAYRS